MESQWRNPLGWRVLGSNSGGHPADPKLPQKMVRVRAIGPRRFCIGGAIVPEGAVVEVSENDVHALLFTGKAEYA
jgi:hypothetical protein